MYRITEKRELAAGIKLFKVEVRDIARKAQPGHFVIVRTHDTGERIPLTIADSDPDGGTITLVVQEMGAGTKRIGRLEVGDHFLDVLGPLGSAGTIEDVKRVLFVAGGVGVAPVYPYAKRYHQNGAHVTAIIGARSEGMLIMRQEMSEICDEMHFATDDGSFGHHGFVTDVLKSLLEGGKRWDLIMAIGPAVMMRAVCNVTLEYRIKTMVSLNAVMVDGTGMCGGCRVTVGGKTRFSCVDGPEFDGHQVDFGELIARQRAYVEEEAITKKIAEDQEAREHACRLNLA